jgi:EAL domain-containing protein (putative c-di-GMP-specific phosphodiesterase class I)
VRLVLDRFGGPNSSLLQLRRLPIDEVKIHPLFFQSADSRRDGSALTMGLLAMARYLRLRSIATGIETERQLELIEARQCDEFQGPLVGAPMTEAAFAEKWLPA